MEAAARMATQIVARTCMMYNIPELFPTATWWIESASRTGGRTVRNECVWEKHVHVAGPSKLLIKRMKDAGEIVTCVMLSNLEVGDPRQREQSWRRWSNFLHE